MRMRFLLLALLCTCLGGGSYALDLSNLLNGPGEAEIEGKTGDTIDNPDITMGAGKTLSIQGISDQAVVTASSANTAMTVGSGAKIEIGGASIVSSSSLQMTYTDLTNSGTINVTGGNNGGDASLYVKDYTQPGGELTIIKGTGPAGSAGPASMTIGGNADVAGIVNIQNGATLEVTNGYYEQTSGSLTVTGSGSAVTIGGVLYGGGAVSVSDGATLTAHGTGSETLGGLTVDNATATFVTTGDAQPTTATGNVQVVNGGTLDVQKGMYTQQSGTLTVGAAGTDATFKAQSFTVDDGASAVINGTSSSNNAQIAGAANIDGSLTVTTATATIGGAVTSTGTVSVAGSGMLLANGGYTQNAGGSLTVGSTGIGIFNSGTFTQNAGDVSFNGVAATDTTATITGAAQINGGTMAINTTRAMFNSTLDIGQNGTMDINGGVAQVNGALTSAGTIDVTNGGALYANSTSAAAVHNLTVDGLNSQAQFSGNLTATGDVAVKNNGSLSAVDKKYTQTGGSLDVDASTGNATFSFSGGSMEFSGPTAVRLTGGNGTLDFGAPTITFKGASSLTALGTENIALGTTNSSEFTFESGTSAHSQVGYNKAMTFQGNSFTLNNGATLDMTKGDVKIETDTATLNGTLKFGSEELVDITKKDTYGDLTIQTKSAASVGSTAKVVLNSKFATAITNASGDDGSLAAPVQIVTSLDKEPSYALSRTATVENAAGKFELTIEGGNLKITRVLDKTVIDDTIDIDAYMERMDSITGGGPLVRSGFVGNSMGVFANEAAGGNATTLGTAKHITNVTQIYSDGSAAGIANYNFMNALNEGLYVLSPGEAEAYSGASVSKANGINFNSAMQMQAAINRHLGQVRADYAEAQRISSGNAYASPDYAESASNKVWGGVLGQWENAKAKDGIQGYKYNAYGIMVGFDRMMGPLTLGAGFGYMSGSYKDKAMHDNSSDIDNYSLNLYANYACQSGFWGAALVGWNHARNDLEYVMGGSNLDRYKEKYNNNSLYAEVKGGYDVWLESFRLTPSLGLGYISSNAKAHDQINESRGFAPLHYDRFKANSGYLPIGLEAAYEMPMATGVLSVSANLGYTYHFNAKGAEGTMNMVGLINGSRYKSVAQKNGHHTVNLGLGAKYENSRWEAGLKYDYYKRSQTRVNRLYGNVGIKF